MEGDALSSSLNEDLMLSLLLMLAASKPMEEN